ncbi:PREDICTED: uncharacterized protein LOC106750921 isoform X2 [Dinoponera quadriceps]|nr:PREDICTED: uncharacterized protein LOC106750921 isoform X2 [Dinoponera quadriceps]XP_014487077.1 PREDICTED: uncharacterized protein LOC106750921 isoform X2 [Dinoponera quadriceps]
MAANALEEKINKIKQQNEEIRRRYEEVEEDKKNAAKLNALVQMVPSTDWPERKEPPEFSNPPRASNKPKPVKEHHEHIQQYHAASGEGRKVHTFAQGQGPPPDPKYNFLADSEREEGNMESIKDNPPNRGQKHPRGTFRRKLGGKDGMQRDYRTNRGPHRDEHQPEYEAWRAERNRIDEDRISRQRTAEGNWRREWDNDKAHIMNEVTRSEAKLGDYVKKDHKDYDRRYHVNGNDYAHHNRGGNHRSYRGNSKHFHSNYENRSNNAYHQDGHTKNPLSPGSEGRTVIATDKGIKVTLNQGNMTKGPVTSVKVNSPSIAGTGRVGPRQRSRVTYSSHSDVEVTSGETDCFSRPKSFEDKPKGIYHDNLQRSPNARKTQPLQRRKDIGNKSPYFRKKEIGREDINENAQKPHEVELRPSQAPEECKDSRELEFKPEKLEEENNAESPRNDDTDVKESAASSESGEKARELNNCDNQSNDLNTQTNVSEVCAEVKSESTLTNLEPVPASQVQMEIEASAVENESNETEIVQAAASSECKVAETDSTSATKEDNDNDKNEEKFTVDTLCDVNNESEKITKKNEDSNLSMKQTEEIVSDNCDRKRIENTNEQENDVKRDAENSPNEKKADNAISSSPTDLCSVTGKNKSECDDKALKEEKVLIDDKIAAPDEKININDKQATEMTRINETQECTVVNNNEEEKNDTANDKTVESSEGVLQVEKEKALSNEVVEAEK